MAGTGSLDYCARSAASLQRRLDARSRFENRSCGNWKALRRGVGNYDGKEKGGPEAAFLVVLVAPLRNRRT
jgi:hypothetical protein